MSLGENIRALRIKNGLTQKELSEAVSVNRVNLAHYESGAKTPSVSVLTEIADFLDCSIDGLLDRKNFIRKE